jgi:hypothetical protein
MLGNLYVAGRYWEAGYSDSELAKAGSGKQRKRYLIGDRQYWADESELPGLILAVAAKPVKQPVAVAKARAKVARRAQDAPEQRKAIPIRPAPVVPLHDRLEALRAQFAAAENEILLRSLAIVAAKLQEMDEDDEMILLAL